MQFCCSLSGASAPLDPTCSTVQEQQTGFSPRYDDTHVFYVCMYNSLRKMSSTYTDNDKYMNLGRTYMKSVIDNR